MYRSIISGLKKVRSVRKRRGRKLFGDLTKRKSKNPYNI